MKYHPCPGPIIEYMYMHGNVSFFFTAWTLVKDWHVAEGDIGCEANGRQTYIRKCAYIDEDVGEVDLGASHCPGLYWTSRTRPRNDPCPGTYYMCIGSCYFVCLFSFCVKSYIARALLESSETGQE